MYFSEKECFNPMKDVWGEDYRKTLQENKDLEESKNSALYKLAETSTSAEVKEEPKNETNINIDLGNLVSNLSSDINTKYERLRNPTPTKTNPLPASAPILTSGSFRGSLEVNEDVPKKRGRKKKSENTEEDETDERESVDFFEKRFEKPLKRITNIIEELDSKKTVLEDEVSELKPQLKQSRSGPLLEYVGKAESNIIDLIKAKLSAVKEEVNVYTKISDLELKRSKNASEASTSTEGLMSKIYENLSGAGGGFPVSGNMSTMSMNDIYDQTLDPSINNIDDALDARYSNLMNHGLIKESRAEQNLKYADRNVQTVVIKSENSNDWRFAVLDSISQQEIYDYSKPSVMGNMRFDEIKGIAYDSVNKYELIIVPGDIGTYEEIDYVNYNNY